MDYVRFLIDTSIGELEIQLFEDGWTAIDLSSDESSAPSIEDRVRNVDDLARGLRSIGVQEPESMELATEVWGELSETERVLRSQLRGLDDGRKGRESQ